MSKSQILIKPMNKDITDVEEYTLEIVGTLIKLSASNEIIKNCWTDKGLNNQKGSIEDTGDNVKIKINKKVIMLDYIQMEQLDILLTLWKKENKQGNIILKADKYA